MDTARATEAPPDRGSGDAEEADGLGLLLAGLVGAAGLVHLVMSPVHAPEGFADALGFAAVGWAQVALALALLLGHRSRALLGATAVLNAAVLGLWIWSRTAGLPFGSHAGEVEPVALVDGLVAVLEVSSVLVAVTMLVVPQGLRLGRLVPAVAAVAVLGLATVALVDPDTASHGGADHHGAVAASGDDHGHGSADHVAEMARIDEERCDLAINPVAYWEEARAIGVDTYTGGEMEPHWSDEEVAELEAFRSAPGTPELDKLVSATSLADGGEAAAGALVAELGRADDATYEQWRLYLRSTGAASGGHDHGGAAAPDDNDGHGGHVGPTPWIAMTDQAECDQLTAELDLAREVAMRYPTAQDAMDGGWVKVTGYVPGIAAHYMNFRYVDGVFDIEEPEMLLYDGEGPEASMVGLSYYVLQPGDAEPTQGFTGPNDHFHRHIGLCIGPTGVIGDSTTTEEECAERGGYKAGGSAGWMNHVWIVPGCESPWGMFSGASPMLDATLRANSGTDGGGCAGSGVASRYDLSPGSEESVPGVVEFASGPGG